MGVLMRFLANMWAILLELSPWLLLGMLIAGLLHVLLPSGFIRRHLGGNGFVSIFKAVAVGVPMPLCSCGVIPTAVGLKKDGASDAAATGFLISTPQTGVDSILVSATFLGWPFAVFKVFSALVSGLVGGVLVNVIKRDGAASAVAGVHSCCQVESEPEGGCCGDAAEAEGVSKNGKGWGRLVEAGRFGFVQLLGDIYRWVVVGVLVAALISTLVPEGKLATIGWTQGIWGMVTMLVISLPMYICATASVPLAASLVIAGMSPGSALVLLMAGPTTNIATMGAIYRSLGKKVLIIYITTVAVMSVGLGLVFDGLLQDIPAATSHMHALPGVIRITSAAVLLVLMGFLAIRRVTAHLGRK